MAIGKQGTVKDYLRLVAIMRVHDEAGDGRLLEQFVTRRDENAFALLLRRHGPMVLHVGRRILGAEQDAEDVFQATFLLLARKADSIRRRDSVASWLYGVAYRLARRVKQQNAFREDRERRAAMAAVKPGVEASARELQEVLQDVLAHLPERYRTPLVLCYLEGRTQEEVARQLGRPLGTVRGWLARGRDLLRKRLARRGLLYSTEALAAVLLANTASASAVPVPARLVRPTLRAALPFAAGEEAAGLVSAEVAGLVREGLKVMAAYKFRAGIGILLALAVLAAGAGVAAQSDSGGETAAGRRSQIAGPWGRLAAAGCRTTAAHRLLRRPAAGGSRPSPGYGALPARRRDHPQPSDDTGRQDARLQ